MVGESKDGRVVLVLVDMIMGMGDMGRVMLEYPSHMSECLHITARAITGSVWL